MPQQKTIAMAEEETTENAVETLRGVAEPGLEPSSLPASTVLDGVGVETATAAAQLGSTRYVLAGFFLTGIALAFVLGKVLSSAWGYVGELAWTQQHVPFLARVGEEERSEYSTVIGGIVAIFAIISLYRRSDIRQWTGEVASELAKVTWPDRAEVTNSTVVVIVASAFATLYLALLDRLWGFVTNLVYGS